MSNLPKNSLGEIPGSLDRVVRLGEVAPNVCPKCEQAMELAQVDDHFVLLCTSCQGLLIQSQVLAAVVQQRRQSYQGSDAKPTPLDVRQLEFKIDCPGCGLPMDTHPYHGPGNSVIDSCSRCCFTFLDYGELSEIERAPGQR